MYDGLVRTDCDIDAGVLIRQLPDFLLGDGLTGLIHIDCAWSGLADVDILVLDVAP